MAKKMTRTRALRLKALRERKAYYERKGYVIDPGLWKAVEALPTRQLGSIGPEFFKSLPTVNDRRNRPAVEEVSIEEIAAAEIAVRRYNRLADKYDAEHYDVANFPASREKYRDLTRKVLERAKDSSGWFRRRANTMVNNFLKTLQLARNRSPLAIEVWDALSDLHAQKGDSWFAAKLVEGIKRYGEVFSVQIFDSDQATIIVAFDELIELFGLKLDEDEDDEEYGDED